MALSPVPISPPPIVSAHSGQRVHLLACFQDFLPEDFSGLCQAPPPLSLSPSSTSDSDPESQPEDVSFQTNTDVFSLFRVYPSKPTYLPEHNHTLLDAVDTPTLLRALIRSSNLPNIIPSSDITLENLFSAFSSPTAGLLMCWQYSKSNVKTKDEINRLWTYISDPQFNASQQPSFLHDWEYNLVMKYLENNSNPFHSQHSWC